METTVIGDTVNLASRLESLCKVFQTPLLISEHTLHGLSEPQRRCVRFVDRTRVKGKFRPESVYEAFGHLPADQIARRQACLENFEQGVAYYHLRAIERAQPLFEDCLRQCPEDSVALRYLARCQAWQTQGVFEGTGELELELPWLPEYNLGIPEIDAQHQQLWARTLQLLQAVHHERTADWEELLDFLQDYITLHFKTEDAFMQRYAYPFIDEHHQEHRAFIESYQHLRQEIQSGRHDSLYLLFQIDLFLVDWLINHTTKIDRHWGQYILQAGYPAT